jgi:hypothetical protein
MKSRFSIIQFFALVICCFVQFIVNAQPPVDNGDVIVIQGSGLREVESALIRS